jgi:hypothetical protein
MSTGGSIKLTDEEIMEMYNEGKSMHHVVPIVKNGKIIDAWLLDTKHYVERFVNERIKNNE